MAEDIRLSVGADTTQMESQIANAARKATVVIRPTIDSKGLEKISAPLGRITGQADEFSKSMEAANARVLAFGASVGVLNAVAKSFQNIITASTQVEASLKEIQVATGETSGNLERLGKGIFEVARSTGLSFKQASEATLEFARQGGTLEDSLMKAKAALVLTRTTGLDAAEAVKGLTAAVLSFNQVGLDYETVVNKLAAVDTKFAVSSRDLIEGISRSASVAQEAGVSFDELTALITTLQEKTARGGAVIGNALKTIFQRVQTTENLDYIRNLGIAVNDASGDILPATTIIKKLADEFQNLDSATRKGLLIKIGGGFQIDKLAALLNDISNANGTFNRSLEQSTNAGNQGFKKLDELNKTVQASFDRLTTSGTQFAATIGKVAFSDDFRSILNKTSSFLESLNESISGGEEGGATIGKAIVKGIGAVITGPGALLIAGLGIKLFGDLAKFGVDSLKNQLGVTNVKKEQQDIEKSILGLLLQNTAVQSKIVSLEGNKTAQAEYLLSLYSKQAATLEKMSKLSKEIGPSVYEGGIRLTEEGTKNVKTKTAAGGYMPKDVARKMEMQEAPAGASIKEISNFNFGPTEGRGTMIVNSMESVYKTPMGDFVVPSYSKTRTGKPTLFSALGYVPNFAEEKEKEKQKENLLKSLTIDGGSYSFAGLTIGGTGRKAVRSKEITPQILSQIKDPALSNALSNYSKLNFSNVDVGNIYRRRDENLDSLEASEQDIKNHFIKKANDALSPQIGTFIKDELSSLGIKPTATMQYLMKSGRKFDFVNDSMAGTFFETMLKMANMSAEDDNFGQFFNDSNSRFDIYGLKPDIAEQYGLPKKFWEYVEIKSSEKALNDELGTKFIQQLSENGGESLKAKLLAQVKVNPQEKIKTASQGYIPNFAIESTIKKQQVGDFKNLENAKYADPFDEFKARIKVKRLGKNEEKQDQTIGFFRSESDRIAKRLIGNKKNGYKNSQIKDEYFTEWSKAGVDRSSLSAIESLYQTVDPKNKKDYSDKFKALKFRIQGVIGEIAASKALKKNLTSGNSYFDLPNQTEVRTRAKQSAFDVLRKGVNNWLSNQPKNNIANNGVGKKPKKDEIDLKTINLVLPSDSAFIASEGYVPNFAIKELKNAPLMTFGDRVKTATLEQLKYRLGGDETYTTDLAGTKNNENLDINKIKNDMAASILGPNYHLVGSDGNLDKAYYGRLMSAFANYKTGKTNKTAFGEMPEIKTDENKVVTGEVSGFARELKYEKLGQIFDIIAKNRNMQDVWAQIYQTKASAGVRSINAPSEESKISKLVTQFRPVVIDELTKRLKTKISAIMTTIGRDDAEFLALGKSVDIDQYGNLLAPDKLKVDKLQEERRFVMPLETPDKLKRVGKSKLDRIVLKDPKKRPSEGEDSTFYKTKFNASDVLSIIEKSEYPYGSYEKTKEDKYGRTSTAFITGWKGEYGIENKLNKLSEKNPFLAKKIKSNFTYDKIKKKMVVANQAEFQNLRTILETLRDFGVSDWENINFEKSLQTYDVAKTAVEGFIPNFSDTKQLMGKGVGMLYEDPNFTEVGSGQSGKFLIPKSKDELGQKIFYKPGAEKIAQEYNVNQALKQFEKQNSSLFKQNAISFTDIGKLLTYPQTGDETKLAGFEREVVGGSGVDEFVTQALSKKPQEQMFAFGLSEAMAQKAADNILKAYKQKYGPDSIRLYDIYAGNFKVNEVMQKFLIQKTKELFKGGDPYAEVLKLNVEEFNRIAGSKGGLHTMYDTMGSTNVGKTAAVGYVPNFAAEDVDGDGEVTRNDPFIKKLMDSAKKFSPIAKELTNNIIGNLLNMPEGIDLFEIIEQLKFAQKAQEPEAELNRIKTEAELKRKFPKKMKRREDFLKYGYKGPPPEDAPERTAAKGYIPNFSKQAILNAIDREQKESGLPLSAIKVVQDARVRGPQNPDGYAVINNRDEPDGRVPNFSAPSGMNGDLFNAIKEALENLKYSSTDLDTAFKKIAENLGVSGEAVYQVFDKITSSGNEVTNTNQKESKASAQNTNEGNKNAQNKKTTDEKQTKTVQDSLYTLIKWQSAISLVSGAISSLGESGKAAAEVLSELSSVVLLFTQGKEVLEGFTKDRSSGVGKALRLGGAGREGAPSLGSSLSIAGNFSRVSKTDGVGVSGAIGGIAAGLAGPAAVIYAAYKGVDILNTITKKYGETANRTADALGKLSDIQKTYTLNLTEEQKAKSESFVKRVGNFEASTAFDRAFNFQNINFFDKTKQTKNALELLGLEGSVNTAILSGLTQMVQPDAERKFTTERKRGNKEITQTEIIDEMVAEKINEIAGKSMTNFGSYNEYIEAINSNKTGAGERTALQNAFTKIKNSEEFQRKQSEIDKNFPATGRKDSKRSEEVNKLFDDIAKKINKGSLNFDDFFKNLEENFRKNAKEVAIGNLVKTFIAESFLIPAETLKAQINVFGELQKVILSYASAEENNLALKKELLTVNAQEKANLEAELRLKQEERQTNEQLGSAAFDFVKNIQNTAITRLGTSLPENYATTRTAAMEKFAQNVYNPQTTDEQRIKFAQDEVKAIKSSVDGSKELSAEKKQYLSYLEQEVRQLEFSQKLTRSQQAARRDAILIENQRLAIATKDNFIETTIRESLTARLSINQKLLDQDRQRLDIVRKISDIQYETKTLATPNQDPSVKERLDLERSLATSGPRQMEDYQIQRQSALLADRLNALNIAFQRGANASDVQKITEAQDYQSLEQALQTVLDKEAQSINDRVTKAGDAFFIKAQEAGKAVGEEIFKILNSVSESDINSELERAITAESKEDYFKQIGTVTPAAQIAASRYFKQELPTSARTESGLPATSATARNLTGGPTAVQDPKALINAQTEQTIKQLIFAQEKRALDRKLELTAAEITNAQKAIDLRKEERDWQQKLRDSAFEFYQTQLSPYQAEKSAAYRNIGEERTRGLQENTDRMQERSLQSRQAGIKTLQSRGASLSEINSFLTGEKTGPEILKSIEDRNIDKMYGLEKDPFAEQVVEAAKEFRQIILGAGASFVTGKKIAQNENKPEGLNLTSLGFGSKTTEEEKAFPSPIGGAQNSLRNEELKFSLKKAELEKRREDLSAISPEVERIKNLPVPMSPTPQEQATLEYAENLQKSIEDLTSALKEKAQQEKNKFPEKNASLLYNADQPLPFVDRTQNINQLALNKTRTVNERFAQEEQFGKGFRSGLRDIDDEITKFQGKLGKQIPTDFRNGLVDAMRVLSDPNSTASLKERLMGVALAFVNKINEALMINAANRITSGIFGNGQVGTGLTGALGFASGGEIEGGSGVKDDVPAMLMGGEYVIRKDVVNKYGKGFFDKLNQGKVQGFANGGMVEKFVNQLGGRRVNPLEKATIETLAKMEGVKIIDSSIGATSVPFGNGNSRMAGFEETNLNDLIRNPNKYTNYGENRMAGLSFDQSGKVTGIENYQGKEEDKQDALLKAQTNFYSQNQQTGQNGFFMPGSYGQGAIIGQKNLLSFATQETIGTKYDKFSSSGNSASIDIAGGSGNLSLFALRDQGNVRNTQYLESKNKALDLYFQDYQTSKDKIRMDFENEKEYKRQMEEWEKAKKEAEKQARRALVTQLATTAIMAGVSYAGSAMSKGVSATKQAAALQGRTATFGEKFTGAFTGGSFGGESRGGLANIFNSSATKDFSTIGAGALGQQGGGLYSWNNKTNSYSRMSMDTYNAQFPLGASYDKLGTPTALNSGTYFDSFYGRNRSVYNGRTAPMAIPVVRRAAGGYVAGNGMGDNVPAMLNGGEFVISKQAAQKTGYGDLQKLNSTGEISGNTGEMASRIEAKLEELVEKIAGVGTINISVNSDGQGEQKESQTDSKQDQQNKELARRIKEVVLSVLRDEKRLGGMLR